MNPEKTNTFRHAEMFGGRTHRAMPTSASNGGEIIFRPFDAANSGVRPPFSVRKLRHPLFSWFGLRPIIAQHTRAEHDALLRWVCDRRTVVEIGVAEGASACALREAMSPEGILYLIDPFHLSRVPLINTLRRAAHAAVAQFGACRVVWIEQFSQAAVGNWREPIDLLFIDGDHEESAVRKDWDDWSRFVVPGGVVLFHDARVFENGWPDLTYGPVRVVNRLFRDGEAIEWRIVEEADSLIVVERKEG